MTLHSQPFSSHMAAGTRASANHEQIVLHDASQLTVGVAGDGAWKLVPTVYRCSHTCLTTGEMGAAALAKMPTTHTAFTWLTILVGSAAAFPTGAPAYACDPAFRVPHGGADTPFPTEALAIAAIGGPSSNLDGTIPFTPGLPLRLSIWAPQPDKVIPTWKYGFMVSEQQIGSAKTVRLCLRW